MGSALTDLDEVINKDISGSMGCCAGWLEGGGHSGESSGGTEEGSSPTKQHRWSVAVQSLVCQWWSPKVSAKLVYLLVRLLLRSEYYLLSKIQIGDMLPFVKCMWYLIKINRRHYYLGVPLEQHSNRNTSPIMDGGLPHLSLSPTGSKRWTISSQ